jgi:hypothetical protein
MGYNMRKLISFAFLLMLATPTFATTWYVNPNGGTRYSTNMTSGQCSGQSPQSYAAAGGTGVNQNCAFGNIEYLWSDGSGPNSSSTFPAWGWIGASGDTYLIDCPSDCRIGWATASSSGPLAWNDIAGKGVPVPISGTAGAHTKILGINYANCTSDSSKAHINGGYADVRVFDLRGASYVDMACLNITDHSDCGQANQVHGCSQDIPLTDFSANGIQTNNTSTNITLTDMRIHGMASAGIVGATGGGWVVTRVVVAGNAASGWDFDDSSGTSGTGTLLMEQFQTLWSGCAEEYPIVDSLPYQDCTDDDSSGYGDGIGTGDNDVGWLITIDHSVAAYNTQDGFDLLHLRGPGSSLTISNSLAYSNMGNQMKSGRASTYYNNLIYANCDALANSIPGTPSGFNSRLDDFCRAGNEALIIAVNDGATSYFEFNTVYGTGFTGSGDLAGIVCANASGTTDCTAGTAALVYKNNITLGFSSTSWIPPARWTDGTGAPGGVFYQTGSAISNNDNYGTITGSCPISGETNTLCLDPQLTDETWHLYGYGNMAPVSSSRVLGAGVAISGITTDYNGVTRPNPPAIGALEYGGTSYTLTVSTSGTGTGGISGSNCSTGSYTSGTTIGACTATPNSGSVFAGWTGTLGCTGTGTCTETLTGNSTMNAVFNLAPTGPLGVMQGTGIMQGTAVIQ